jgi:hypothetical protein
MTSKRRFALHPMWVHIEQPPWGLRRLRWLRWGPAKPEVDEQRRLDRERRGLLIWTVVTIGMVLMLTALVISGARARDLGQWEETTPEVRAWYKSLMQPDKPWVPCCGESDAYFAEAHVRDGKTYAVIIDDRPDEPRGRHHVPVGTEIEVPAGKFKWDAGNPTGHAVIFLSINNDVYCFVQGTGDLAPPFIGYGS